MNIAFDHLVSKREVCRLFNWSNRTLWRRIRAGEFPPPVDPRPGRPSEWWASTLAEKQRELGGKPREMQPEQAAA